jgi:hypothetical protein
MTTRSSVYVWTTIDGSLPMHCPISLQLLVHYLAEKLRDASDF